MLGVHDLIVLLAIAVVLFGARKLPWLRSSIGKSMKALKKGISGTSGR